MARKPKPNSSGRRDHRTADSTWQRENRSMRTDARARWFSAHEYTTSDDTLRTPTAEDKPGIGAPSARQERDAPADEIGAPAATASHERPSRNRRRARARSSRDAASRSRRARQAR